MAAPLWVFLMAAATNAAACWGDVTEIPVCERTCVCRRGFFVCTNLPKEAYSSALISRESTVSKVNFDEPYGYHFRKNFINNFVRSPPCAIFAPLFKPRWRNR